MACAEGGLIGVRRIAHSAPYPDRSPDRYVDHVTRTVAGARAAAEGVLPHVRDGGRAARFLRSVVDGATFHDLGKLESDTQFALAKGRSERLIWDHVDAGVAHLMGRGAGSAAWIVRAHHAPGLPDFSTHFPKGWRLRGRRKDDLAEEEHDRQIVRTDSTLADLLAAHDADCGAIEPTHGKTEHGLFLRLALSCLVDGDHGASAYYESGWEPQPLILCRWEQRLSSLDSYVAGLALKAGARQADRAEFYAACRSRPVGDSMVTCEGPVGIGKTTAAMAWLLRRAIETGARRIFVIAPYTAILSQTADVLRQALVLQDEEFIADRVVAEHHHRADLGTMSSRDIAVLWRAPIVLTTAVQFFETLASNEPSRLRKFHALPGSAILVDEAHAALPSDLLRQNWRWMCELTRDWGCSFVFASGSLARFWEDPDIVGDEQVAKLGDLSSPKLTKRLVAMETRRVRYRTEGRIDGGINSVTNAILAAPGPRLAIFNTVQSAALIARHLKEEKNCEVLHLSTALCPDDRGRILEQVKRRLSPLNDPDWCLISTSLVEAGVDFSFRAALRERFSVASLIQTGGRVNRHGTHSTPGEVVDFFFDRIDLLSTHPAAKRSMGILEKLFEDGTLASDVDAAGIVSDALHREAEREGGRLGYKLSKAEDNKAYPEVARLGLIIDSDTRLVVVKDELRRRLEDGEKLSSRTLLGGSVQIWRRRFDDLGLEPIRGRGDIFWWPHAYESTFLGYMAGALKFITSEAFLI